MTETNPEESTPATPNPPAEVTDPTNNTNTRDREHTILQQVLALLAQPAQQILSPDDGVRVAAENQELRTALSSMAGLLRDKSGQVLTLERKVGALGTQITSLKEVVTITKDLLNIRNMEVQHLNKDINSMEGKIDEQRKRHNDMIAKMEQASKLNSQLKQEYETQLKLFQDLREKYIERDVLQRGAAKENEETV